MYISCIQQKLQKLPSPSPKVMLSSLHIASRYRTHPVLFYHATFTVSIMLRWRKPSGPLMRGRVWSRLWWRRDGGFEVHVIERQSGVLESYGKGPWGEEFTWRLEGSMRRIFVSRDALLNMMVLPSLFKAQLRCNIWKPNNAHHRYHLRCFMQREIWAFQTWPRTWSPARATREINIWIRQVLHMWHLGCASPSRSVPL